MKKHLLAANNFFLGVTNFLILPLPDSWQLVDILTPPDVDASFTSQNISWVTSGSVNYLLADPQRSLSLELLLQIKKGNTQRFKPVLKPIESQGILWIGKHAATQTFGKITRGVFKKRWEEGLQILLPCEVLQRTLCLTFTGNCSREVLQEILKVIPYAQCHT
ncbi:MAG TPA: hypothetical protein VNM22_00975 [Candidatus Limnocylindrales bacterium]|nr:hypothetical protein [Candidatus Limnocylindrales bacterium]